MACLPSMTRSGGFAAILDTQGLFECNFIERINAHLQAIGFNAAAVAIDANPHGVIHDALQADQNLLHVTISLGYCGKQTGAARRPRIVYDVSAVYKSDW